MKALVIGVNGFVGGYLADCLRENGMTVHGTFIGHADIKGDEETISLHELDITNIHAVQDLMIQLKPDIIFHLAAQSSAAISWKQPQMTMDVNVNGTINVLESIRNVGITPRILLVGSSEEYGFIGPENDPVNEKQCPNPGNPYAISKLAQSMIGQLYYKAYHLDIVIARAFNHIGPKQSEIFVVSDFAKRISMIEKGLAKPVLKVGNLDAVRDFSDVRDIVKAYVMLAAKGRSGQIYNVGSGCGMAIGELLKRLLKRSAVKISLEMDPERLRPSDIPFMVADTSKIREEVGWSPTINLDETLDDILKYWRVQVNGVL